MGWFSRRKKEPEFVEPPTKFKTSVELPDIDPMLSANTRTVVDASLAARADALIFTLTAAGTQLHYVIDGVTHEAGVLDPQFGSTAMAIIKVHAGMDLNVPRPQQEGDFEILRRKKKSLTPACRDCWNVCVSRGTMFLQKNWT